MKFQAFIEQMESEVAAVRIDGKLYHLPRKCLPVEAQEADILDVVIFVNERETERRINQLRKWLIACGAYRAMELNGLRLQDQAK
jgi:tRNA U55 pseudouridine synthase TruB